MIESNGVFRGSYDRTICSRGKNDDTDNEQFLLKFDKLKTRQVSLKHQICQYLVAKHDNLEDFQS